MKNQAFTLIELLVVVLIIGILAAIAVPQYQKSVLKSRFTKMILYNDAIVKAQKTYFLANGNYTKNLEDLDITLPAGHNCWMTIGGMIYTNCALYRGSKAVAVLQRVLSSENRTDCCTFPDTNYEADYLCADYAGTTNYTMGGDARCFIKYN